MGSSGHVLNTSINSIEIKNRTTIMEFILVGLSATTTYMQIFLFCLFITIYVAALSANFILILTIWTFRKLHTPMYFFIVNLSLVNVFSISVTIPKLLQSLFTGRKTISFHGCLTQTYMFIWAVGTELLHLSFMAFDRYAAICHPFQYPMIMRKEVCFCIAIGVWVIGLVNTSTHSGLLSQLSFCNSNIINHFFCDLPPLLHLSCSDPTVNVFVLSASDWILGVGCCGFTLTSYFFIIRTICRIRSTEGKKKAFSTCSSHFIIVSIFYSSVIYTYIRPSSAYSPEQDKVVALLYSVVTPLANPVIYTLRNKDFKEGLKTLIGRIRLFSRLQY
ncbi:olfactory receptor 5F1-like [Pantherophis guttatus]|uniref:Olfactory receptor n=1 Tax=Pantherophis guttatus TaxID=94885 RepID=A0A6P9C5L9_PANGU|nr:olfactory receptor 5F1-like [Pantherophis guttatus]